MKITINAQDYSATLDAVRPLTIVRKLNEPSVCELWLSLPGDGSVAAPARNQSIEVTGDNGTIFFTGYLAVSPLPEYAGMGQAGPVYRLAIQAVSDEILLDTQQVAPSQGTIGETVGTLLQSTVTRTGSKALSTTGLTLNTAVSQFAPQPGEPWSKVAGRAANLGRASYRAAQGALTLTPVANTVHTLSETAGTLELAALTLTSGTERALANDVTVCGEHEPVAYVTEYFQGDGTTTTFDLSADPFFLAASKSTLIAEAWNEAAIDGRYWTLSGSGSFYSLGGGGLTMNGGTGVDGQAVVSWNDNIELGGTLLLEAVGVSLSLGSTGLLAALYNGTNSPVVANCMAAFQVIAASGTGALTLAPLVNGSVVGSSFAINPANQYALRIRVNCPEMQRETAAYRVSGDSGEVSYGPNYVLAPGKILMDIQQFVDGVASAPVVLYDGSLTSLPSFVTVAAASSINLIGTMRGINLVSLGSSWVVSTPPSSGAYTRRVGSLAEAAECHMERTGVLAFYPGSVPVAGEMIAAHYRTIGRAVGRAINTTSQTVMAAQGWPAAAVWEGTVTEPAARSSADCQNAANALVSAASSVSAAWSGSYQGWSTGLSGDPFAGDVLPGDALLLLAPSTSLNAQVVARVVTVSYRASYPDLVHYKITFANDWANDLSVKTSKTVPADTWLPATISPTLLANLNGLAVSSLTGSAIEVAANVTPPTGGGFEVRRRDFSFRPGQDTDLVLRSPVANFTIPRAAASERFYIRMYDASTPPNYSAFSTALFVNIPL